VLALVPMAHTQIILPSAAFMPLDVLLDTMEMEIQRVVQLLALLNNMLMTQLEDASFAQNSAQVATIQLTA